MRGFWSIYLAGGVNTQSDAVACNDIPSACIRIGGNEATLPARGIAHAHLPTAATGLDDARHCGWAWKLDVRWKLGGPTNHAVQLKINKNKSPRTKLTISQ